MGGQERAAVQAWSQTSRSWKSSMIKNPKASKAHQHENYGYVKTAHSNSEQWLLSAIEWEPAGFCSQSEAIAACQGFLIKRGRFMPTSKWDARCLTLFAYQVPNCMEEKNMIDDSAIIKHVKTECFWRNFTQTLEVQIIFKVPRATYTLNHG